MSALFSPLTLRSSNHAVHLPNRIVVAPMCQYSAQEGQASDWHLAHWASLLNSGAGLVTIEATGVSPEGRITPHCLGLFDDACALALSETLQRAKALAPPTPISIQLSHAGRKASCAAPWRGGAQLSSDSGGWSTLAPSSLAHNPSDTAPQALDQQGIERIIQDFAKAAQRAQDMGIDVIELHAAHGYLIHQFLSPLSNQRQDAYGGSFEGRIRFALEVFQAVREVFSGPLGMRISATDWVDGGWTPEETAQLCVRLKSSGADFAHISSGGLSTLQKIVPTPGYQVEFARLVKKTSQLPTMAVGLITTAEQAQAVIESGDADMVAIARALLYKPRWPWEAAAHLNAHVSASPQYWRCLPPEAAHVFNPPQDSKA
jgi:2,4-dienoyl-CoA reductase-like NADH-dependent reductase (Old Yellow Enzyme family)